MYKIIDFKKYSSINIGGKVKVKVIDQIGDYSQYSIIGGANNLLLAPSVKNIAILSDDFNYIINKNGKLIVGAATPSSKLLSYCKKFDIANFELLARLPGMMGGLVKMNAGLKEWEIFNHLDSITTQDGIIKKDDIEYTYRKTKIDGIIFEITFNIEKSFNKARLKEFTKMRENQPKQPSAGSCFKNPQGYSAGALIENVGLKGYTIGGMSFSAIHANFLVNLGGGTFDEAVKLINLAKTEVKKVFNIQLEEEIIIIK